MSLTDRPLHVPAYAISAQCGEGRWIYPSTNILHPNDDPKACLTDWYPDANYPVLPLPVWLLVITGRIDDVFEAWAISTSEWRENAMEQLGSCIECGDITALELMARIANAETKAA